jgi:hypothetical protein
MFHPRRLRTRSGPSVETLARKPSHFTSYAQAPRAVRVPDRASMVRGVRCKARPQFGPKLNARRGANLMKVG